MLSCTTLHCAWKQVRVLISPDACDHVMSLTHTQTLKPCAGKYHARCYPGEWTLGLHSPAGCAPGLQEGLLGNLLLCNEDEGVI